jgi:tetratricopeptide (TPR) repeat protein
MKKRAEPAEPPAGGGEPEDWAAYTNRGNARQAARDFEGAIADFTRAVELAPGKLAPWYNRGNARALSGKAALAIDDYTEALRIDPAFAPAYARRGLARQRAGDLGGAHRDLTLAIDADPSAPEPYSHRAAVRGLLGDLAGARADCERSLELAPEGWKHRAEMVSLLETLHAAEAETVGEEKRMAATRAKKTAKKAARKATKKAARKAAGASPVKRGAGKAAGKDAAKKTAAKKTAAKGAAKKTAAKKGAAKKGGPAKRSRREPPTATQIVEGVLAAAGWQFDREDNEGWSTFSTPVDDGGSVAATVARLSEELQRFVLYVVFRESASAATIGETAEFVTRANWGLGDGNFEMSPESGEVRFKVALDYTGVPLAPLLVRNVILDAMDATEVYEQALTAVMRGDASAKAAIEAAEGSV